MVFRSDGKGSGWHEPPYTWKEEMEFYRRTSPKPGVPMTIYRGSRGPAGKPVPTSEQSSKKEEAQERDE
jgi:hypothetical protein